ncbi:MAG TPA: DUF6578 domain-containing protein [Pilimelia sp.]|nr:DUF6578 domain-containing protein [Pilimelia sp.]
MECTVWVAEWQMECCGDPFRCGERVAWTVLVDAGVHAPDWLPDVLGELAVPVDAVEEHHGRGAVEPMVGTVVSIEAVSCRFAPGPGDGRTRVLVAGSGVTTDVALADGRTPPPSGTKLMGYLVRLTGAARGEQAACRPR